MKNWFRKSAQPEAAAGAAAGASATGSSFFFAQPASASAAEIAMIRCWLRAFDAKDMANPCCRLVMLAAP